MDEDIFVAPIRKARALFQKNYSRYFDFKIFRCDMFLIQIIRDNNIGLDSHHFSSEKFCGLLTIDELETTILYNKNSPPYRRNFTIAHELGHYFLHRHLKSNFPDRTSDLLTSTNNKMEKQANAFASEIVLPILVLQIMLNSRFSFRRISSTTQTSHECLRYRLHRHLQDLYELPYGKILKLVDDFENASFLGYKNNDLTDFIASNRITKIIV